jgi:outer membrane protein OmpA-like peptidoglycan-associated protein
MVLYEQLEKAACGPLSAATGQSRGAWSGRFPPESFFEDYRVRRVRFAAGLSPGMQPGVRARWGDHVECRLPRDNQRYVGPVFAMDAYLAQRVSKDKVILHRRDDIDYSTTRRLQRRADRNRLNDATLAIYYIEGRRLAFLRETRSGSPRRMGGGRQTAARSRFAARSRAREAATVAAAVAATLMLASCASHRLVTPNGSHRVAINTPDSLSRYQDIVAREDAMVLEKSELQRKVEALSSQLAELKSDVQSARKSPPPEPSSMQNPAGSSPRAVAPDSQATPAQPAGPPSTESILVSPDRVVFRVNHPVGKTQFAPSESFEEPLLRAAREARTILIRGRTDSDTVDDVETRIALLRALRARDYLVNNGVESSKIRVWYRAAGGFIADNSTAGGKAMNRRVEIEARGLDTAAFAPRVAEVRLGSNR